MDGPDLLEDRHPTTPALAGRLTASLRGRFPPLDRVTGSRAVTRHVRRMISAVAVATLLIIAGHELHTGPRPAVPAKPEVVLPSASNRLSGWPLRGDLRTVALREDTAVGAQARRMVTSVPGSRLLFAGHVDGTIVLLTALAPGSLFVRYGSASASYSRDGRSWVEVPARPVDGTVFAAAVPTDEDGTGIVVVAPPDQLRVEISIRDPARRADGRVRATRRLVRSGDGVVTVHVPGARRAVVQASLIRDSGDSIRLPL